MARGRRSGKAVVLLSGGLDSATVLAVAKSKGHELYAISFDYRQRHKRELESARQVASAFSVRKHLIVDFDLREIGGSALTSDLSVPKSGSMESGPGAMKRSKGGLKPIIPVTYVPARNTIFLSFALAWAEVLKAGRIFIGANAIDYSGYPDCRPEYLRAFSKMANLATKAAVEKSIRFKIEAPLISMTKAEIIKTGIKLGLDYSMTWSCYDPQPAIKRGRISVAGKESVGKRSGVMHGGLQPCMRCDSCRLRAKGFMEARIKDPLISQL